MVAALIAVAASDAGSSTREDIEYLDRLAEQSQDLALSGEALRDVVSRLSRIDRPELVTVIEELRTEIAAGEELVAEEPPSEELFAVRSLYRLALSEWSVGTSGFISGVLSAADNPEDTASTSNIADAIASLRSGDRLFADLLDEIERLDVPDPAVPIRSVTLSPATGELLALGTAYTEAARSPNNGLALRPGLAASSIVSLPDWQLNPENVPVMPATETARFSVIISNVGNLVSQEEQVVLTLTAVDEGGDPITMALQVAPLEPGDQTTLEFDPMPVSPGQAYEIAAVINVQQPDSNIEDNEIRVGFRVNTE